jgi:DNA-binding NarL/FixJ family response regulator
VLPADALADRVPEVFHLITQGVKNEEIAGRLHLSLKTMATYRDRIRVELELDDGVKLVPYATQ